LYHPQLLRDKFFLNPILKIMFFLSRYQYVMTGRQKETGVRLWLTTRVIYVHEPETVMHWHGLVHQVVHRSLRACFSDDNSDSREGHGQQEGDNIDCDLTFEASCCSSEHHLIKHGGLNDLVRDTSFSKTQAELLVPRQ
jgi:hypothetical protein